MKPPIQMPQEWCAIVQDPGGPTARKGPGTSVSNKNARGRPAVDRTAVGASLAKGTEGIRIHFSGGPSF